jgi:hypothetical protein
VALSRYDLFRKRIAPVAFAVALAALAHETCNRRGGDDVTVELAFGAHAAEVRHVRADVFVDGEPDAWMEHDFGTDGVTTPPRFRAMVRGENAIVRIDVDTLSGPHRIERKLAVVDGATVTVDLARDLDPPER